MCVRALVCVCVCVLLLLTSLQCRRLALERSQTASACVPAVRLFPTSRTVCTVSNQNGACVSAPTTYRVVHFSTPDVCLLSIPLTSRVAPVLFHRPSPGHLKHAAICDIGRRMGETIPL